MKTLKKNSLLSTLIPFLIFVGGCGGATDLKSIQNFATLSDVAAEEFPKITADFLDSCIRAARLAPFEFREKSEKNCNDKYGQNFQNSLAIPNTALVNYLTALAQLAADKTVDFDPQLNGLSEAFQGTGIANPSQVNAVNGIAKFLFTAATDNYRRGQLKKAIQSTDSDVQILINGSNGLKSIITENYTTQLQVEAAAIKNYYAVISNAENDRKEPLTALLVDQQYRDKLTAFDRRKTAAMTYVEILNQIAQAHGKLKNIYDRGEKVNSKESRQTVLHYAHTLSLLLEALKKSS